jgi:hypothetical protein
LIDDGYGVAIALALMGWLCAYCGLLERPRWTGSLRSTGCLWWERHRAGVALVAMLIGPFLLLALLRALGGGCFEDIDLGHYCGPDE